MPTPITTLSTLQLVTPVLPANTSVLSTDSSVLPIVVDADLNTTRIEISIYNTVYGLDNYTTTSGFNQFSTSVPLTLTVQETNVQILGRNYDPNISWLPNNSYAVGARQADPNGNVEVVVSAGVSGAAQPTWSTVLPETGTNVTVLNNVVTIQTSSTNSFNVGQQVYFTGFANATFLNGQILTVTFYSPTSFNVSLNTANYGPTADSGTCQAVTTDNGVLWANIGAIAVTPIIKFSLLAYQSNLAVVIAPPSGISALKDQTDCTIQWVTPDYPGFIGVRVMLSTDSAGINPPYSQYGDLVVDVSSTAITTISTQSNTSQTVPTAQITAVQLQNNLLTITAQNTFTTGEVVSISNLINATFLNNEELTILTATPTYFTAAYTGQNYPYPNGTPAVLDNGSATSVVFTQTTTTTNTVMTTDYSSVDVPSTFVSGQIFYAMLSTVIQDPGTNVMYESVQNGPLLCGFVNLKVTNPTDFPVLQRKEDIAGRMISQVNRQEPNLDLSPRSELRDTIIDPPSLELANLSVREWFARVSTSISAISQVDNVSGNGVSDPFQSSPYKQQIARAYGLSAQDTQNLIDQQFNILGEQAGLTRLTATTATVVLTFYTYQQPQASITVPEGAVVATVADSSTASLNFTTQGQAVIDLSNLASFYNTQTGWWGVSVPAQCNQSGSIGNVGAGTINQVISGVPSGVNVTNLVAAQYGTDQESNAAYAARIQARLVTGIDSSSRNGYLVAALSTPGVIGAQVVAAGDLEMLRDWDPTRQKHVYGCVDIYARGTTFSQNDEFVPFVYTNNGTYGTLNTYATLAYLGNNQFQIQGFNALAYPPYDAVELAVSTASGTFYIGLDTAQFNNAAGILNVNPNDTAYQYVGSPITQAKVPFIVNGQSTNRAALATVGSTPASYVIQLFFREASPFLHVPDLQPVLQIYSVTGEAAPAGTGSVPSNDITLVHTSDFLLNGGSNNAGDTVQIALSSAPITNTITMGNNNSVPTLIAMGMNQPLSATGVPGNVVSVLSTDLSTLYQFGVDYSIVAMGPYLQYGIQPLVSSVAITQLQVINGTTLIVTANNDFGAGALVTFSGITDPTLGPILNNFTATIATVSSTQFTITLSQANYGPAATSGLATGSAIQPSQQVVVTFNQYVLYERLFFNSQEEQVLSGSLPTTLDNDGFVQNTWLPQSYSTGVWTFPLASAVPPFAFNPLALILDGWDGSYGSDGGLDVIGSLAMNASGLVGNQVPYASRYIKLTYYNGVSNVLMKQNIDYTLTVDPSSGAATIARILTGRIPDGATVLVSYFTTETFTVSTQYPAFVEVLANQIAQTQSAAADVLIKAEVANPVDITLSVTLTASTSPETVDPVIRTVIDITLDNADTQLYQSELISQIQAVTGVQSVEIPLIKCAKSDGSYDIGIVVPTATPWTALSSDPAFTGIAVPANSWITTAAVLPDSTIPSGGEPTAIVDFLYQGQAFARTTSVENFLSTALVEPHLAVAPGVTVATPGSFYIVGTNDTIGSATITATSISNNVLSVNFANGTVSVGQLVQLDGTAESFLNEQSVTVASLLTNTSGAVVGFTANFMEGNYSNPNDTGSIVLPSSYAQKVIVTIPADVPNPGNLSYFVTYQVYGEGGAHDITVSSTEYLSPGTITINYITPTTG
jgi:hypothetical protein